MQLSLGMDVSKGLNLDSWQYGSEGPSVSMVLEAMDCHVSTTGSQSTAPQDFRPGNHAEVHCCSFAQHKTSRVTMPDDCITEVFWLWSNSPAEFRHYVIGSVHYSS